MILRAPGFWAQDGVVPRLLLPFSAITAVLTAHRVAKPGWRAPVPVICCGNATVGGTGKTTVVQELARRLPGVHLLTRGYRGYARYLKRVELDDPYALVGDEALLLARVAPTWRCADRAVSAKAAVEAGATALLMDDGLQNPTLVKTASLLIIDGETGFGNGRVLPAGPLREPVEAAASRCQAAIIIGNDEKNVRALLPLGMTVLQADLMQDEAIRRVIGKRILPFAGIGRPEKFFKPLREAGAIVVATKAFPDHYPYMPVEWRDLLQQAADLDARLVTTPKDAVRLPPEVLDHVTVIGVGLRWRDPAALDEFLGKVLMKEPVGVP